jgi:hypothetical protein
VIASGMLHASWPKHPDRAALQRALLQHRRVAEFVHGREPLARDELIAMLAAHYAITVGMAQAAIERSEAAGQIRMWVCLPDGPRPKPGADLLLDRLEAEAAALEAARREAGEGDAG